MVPSTILTKWDNVRRLYKLLESGLVLVVWWGTPCTSFSKARKWDSLGPPPLRTPAFPDGLPELSIRDQLKVDIGNQLADYSARGMEISYMSGTASVLENPGYSYIWQRVRLQQACKMIDSVTVYF